jgi:hypothetical protein
MLGASGWNWEFIRPPMTVKFGAAGLFAVSTS